MRPTHRELASVPASSAEVDDLEPACEPAALLERVCFVVWGFPEPTQTFIHRELVEMERLGGRVQLLAGPRRPCSGQPPALSPITERAHFLGAPPRWLLHGLLAAARRPRRTAEALSWMARKPHRSALHRLRACTMVLAAMAAAERIDRTQIRYVHAHFASYPTELAMALGRLLGVPWGSTFHATDIWRDANLLPEKLAEASIVITCTAHNASHLQRLAPAHARKVNIVPHGLDFDLIGPAPPLPIERPVRWIAVGRLVPKKGFSHLIEAAAALKARGRQIAIEIVGDGPERDALQQAVRARALGQTVTFAGQLGNAEVLRRVRRSFGLVAPCVRDARGDLDGIPNVILEAMALGRPVVASALSGIPEVVRDGDTGALVAPGDSAALAAALDRLGRAPELAAAIGQRGRALVQSQFDVHVNTARMLARIAHAIGGADG
jgi:colanic acid/amylovoran biosynthesis glycosyltransferase